MHGNSDGFAVRVSNVTSAVGRRQGHSYHGIGAGRFTSFVRDKT